MENTNKTILWIIIGVVGATVLSFVFAIILKSIIGRLNVETETIPFTELLTLIKDGKVNHLYIDGYTWQAELVENGRVVASYYAEGAPSIYGYADFFAFTTANGIDPSKVVVEFADPNAGRFIPSYFC